MQLRKNSTVYENAGEGIDTAGVLQQQHVRRAMPDSSTARVAGSRLTIFQTDCAFLWW